MKRTFLEFVSGFVGNNRLSTSAALAAVPAGWGGTAGLRLGASSIPALLPIFDSFVNKVASIDAAFSADWVLAQQGHLHHESALTKSAWLTSFLIE
jgi:hypothetical protein